MTDISQFISDDLKNIPTFRAAYSDRTALLMAKLAHCAYEQFDSDEKSWSAFSDALCGDGFSGCKALIDRDIGTAGYLAEADEIIVVVFRGTEDFLDWKTNVRARFVALEGGTRVHTGFFQAYWPIREVMFDLVISALRKKQRPVYVTGHSLGGALALMATAELANHDDRSVRDSIAACYTFGCPKAGDKSFDQYVKVPLYRVTNGVDIVPFVPPWFGYYHVGDTRYFGKSGIPPLRLAPGWIRGVWRSLWSLGELIRSGEIRNIADHSMAVYLAKLAAWAEINIAETRARRVETTDPEISGR